MAETVKGLKIEISADSSKFDSGLAGSKKQMSLLKNEASNLNKQLKLDPTNVELLGKKLTNLAKQQEIAKNRLVEYKQKLADLGSENVGSDEWIKLQKSINNTETQIAQLEAEATKTKATLDGVGGKAITANTAQAEASLKKLEDQARDSKERLDKVGDGLTNAGNKLLPVTAGIGVGLGYGVKQASDLDEAMNKVSVAFGKSADAIVRFTDNSAKKFGETQSKVLDTASTFGLLGVEADKVPTILQRISDVGSLQNRTWDEVSADFISGFNGSTEAVEKYGIKLKQVDLAQYLVEKGTVANTSEANKYLQALDSTGKQALFYDKILADTASSAGDFSNNQNALTNATKIAQAQLKEIAGELGEQLLPYVEKAVNAIKNLADKFKSLSDSQKELIVKILLIVGALAPLLIIIGNAVKLFAALRFAIVGIQIAMAAGSTLIGALTATTGGLILIVIAVIAVIVGLVLAFKHLYESNEAFRSKVQEIISAIMPALQQAFDNLKALLNDVIIPVIMQLWGIFKENILPILAKLAGFLVGVLGVAFQVIASAINFLIPIIIKMYEWWAQYILPIIKGVASVIGSVLSIAISLIVVQFKVMIGVIQLVWEWLKKMYAKFEDTKAFNVIIAIFGVLKGVIEGVLEVIGWVVDKISTGLKKIKDLGEKASKLNPFDSGGFGFDSAGFASAGFAPSLALTTNINVTNNGNPITEREISAWGRQITDIVDENLGRRGR